MSIVRHLEQVLRSTSGSTGISRVTRTPRRSPVYRAARSFKQSLNLLDTLQSSKDDSSSSIRFLIRGPFERLNLLHFSVAESNASCNVLNDGIFIFPDCYTTFGLCGGQCNRLVQGCILAGLNALHHVQASVEHGNVFPEYRLTRRVCHIA